MAEVVPEKLRTLDHGRLWRDGQFSFRKPESQDVQEFGRYL